MQLTEKYRPKCWNEVIGQSSVVNQIQALKSRGLGGRAYIMLGKSGQGKTTLARLLAAEIASDLSVDERDAGTMTPGRVLEMEETLSLAGMGEKNGRAIIVNECHGMSAATVRQLLVTLERIPKHAAWIFTTTLEGNEMMFEGTEDAGPLQSRAMVFSLAQRDFAKPAAARLREIAMAENLDGQPMEAYIKLVNSKKGNMRACLQEIEKGVMVKGGE